MVHDIGWMAIAVLVVGASYDLLRRGLGNAPTKDIHALHDAVDKLRAELAEHKQTFGGICAQWREKVIELDRKCDSVVRDAKNEIAGSLATVSDITKKGWR